MGFKSRAKKESKIMLRGASNLKNKLMFGLTGETKEQRQSRKMAESEAFAEAKKKAAVQRAKRLGKEAGDPKKDNRPSNPFADFDSESILFPKKKKGKMMDIGF